MTQNMPYLPTSAASRSGGIVNPTAIPASLYIASISITAPLTKQILQQRDLLSPEARTYQVKTKTKIVCDDRMIMQDAVGAIY